MHAVIAALALIISQTPGSEISSAYTTLENCQSVEGPAPMNQQCAGYGDWRVYIGASEHSAGLAYSDRARDAQLSQRPITSARFQSYMPNIEWRLRQGEFGPRAFATIHRWTTSAPVIDPETGLPTGDTEIDQQVLVVSVLREDGPIGACHGAYVNARAVFDANTVARRFADAMADEFRCGLDSPYEIGAGEAARLMERGRL